jgi:thioredoxin reductase (NADPH)
MSQSVIVVIDPPPEVLGAIKEDLQQNYHQELKVLYTKSQLETLKKLKDLRSHNERLTLLIVGQKLPLLEDADLWQLAVKMFPNAKRLMLKVYDNGDIPSRVPIPNAFVVCPHEVEVVFSDSQPKTQLLTSKS